MNAILQKSRHLRALAQQLGAEGFLIEGAWKGRHVRLRVARGDHTGTLTVSSTPRDERQAVMIALQQARRIGRTAR